MRGCWLFAPRTMWTSSWPSQKGEAHFASFCFAYCLGLHGEFLRVALHIGWVALLFVSTSEKHATVNFIVTKGAP